VIDGLACWLPGWILRREEAGPDLRERVGEIPIWIDEPGILTVFSSGNGDEPRYILQFSDEIAVELRIRERIIIERPLRPGVPRSTCNHFLADQVLPRILGHNGDLVLHAAAVRIGGDAIVLLGKSGWGKSTLAASFEQMGFPLLGDDALVVSWDGDMPCVRTVYPSLRLYPDSIAALFAAGVPTTTIAHYTPKLRVSVPLKEGEECYALPIRALFALGAPSRVSELVVKPKSISKACMALVENSFVLDPTDTGRATSRLREASRLAGQVPAFDLCYPRTYSRLADVRTAIFEAVDRAS